MIKVLDKTVADKIAAGEVIERPVSIIKELVENAIDSGGDSLVVEIKNGGKSYIRVTDNGCGIPSDQVETAFLRHATSKIVSAADLDTILTLGFRGEALASIAAVTHTELITKTKDASKGTRLLIHGGQVLSNMATGCPDGTTIIVTDLFYNTPARQKFLKSDAGESGQIIDFMSQIALAYPHIRFRFINNGNIIFSTTGKGDVLGTILSVYKLKEYQNLVPVSYQTESGKVTGYISKPSLTRTNRRNQIFFVNGRVVNSKVIEKGVTAGYKERLFEGRHPVCFLFITIDPSHLDVNIHPNKREIRFDREEEIVDLVTSAIKEALGTKAAVVEVENPFKENSENIVLQDTPKEKNQEQVNIKQLLSTKRNLKSEFESSHEQVSSVKETLAVYSDERKPAITLESSGSQPFSFVDLRITGTVFHTYITAEDDESFYLIDQHAAHERIFYEKLVRQYLAEDKLRQPILTPIMIEVPLAVKENQYDWLDSLEEMGFLIHNFGQNTYIIKEIPTFMSISEAEDFLNTFVDHITEGTKLSNTIIINKLITKSCKAAVKAHDVLSMVEIEALIQQLSTCENPFSCPHGRPTFIRMTKYQIEKMFKRV